MSDLYKNKEKTEGQKEQERLTQFFDLLYRIDMRENPELYQDKQK